MALTSAQEAETRNTPGVEWLWNWPTRLRVGGTTPLPVALLMTVGAQGIKWWGAAVPDSVPLLTALVVGQWWFLRWERGSHGSLIGRD